MQIFDSELCARCKGRGYCGQPCQILSKIKQFFPKTKLHFSGSSPPEVFVGREGYPFVNTGVLAPQEYGQTEEMSMPEIWYEKNLSIQDILNYRSQLIYSRFKSKVSDARQQKKFLSTMQEISIASKSVSTEIFLQKPVRVHALIDKHVPIIGNPAPLKDIRLEENPHVEKKVDYLIYDTDVKSTVSMKELYNSNIPISNIIKILSAGMLGLKKNRKLVPTRWSVTATDDTLSKFLLSKIRYYQEIGEILLFNAEYVGNHYEFLLLPDKFSFEVIEAKMSGSVWNPFSQDTVVMQDYESFSGRKNYANNVTGAYYSNRIALCEYLEKIKHQASCLVMRECKPEYYAPLGVGILREASRDAFSKQPETFNTIDEALQQAQKRMKLPVEFFRQKSWLLKNQGKQTRLSKWF
jgi:DNA repair protein NreA